MPFVALSTTANGCACSDSQKLDAINANLGNGFNALINEGGFTSSASFTRPDDTTAYTALDVVSTLAGAVMVFANIGPDAGGRVLLTSLALEIDVGAIPAGMGAFRLHIFAETPTPIADNAAFNLPAGDRSKYLGFIEIPTPLDLGATLWSETEAMAFPIRKEVLLISDTIYGILQTVPGYTPTALVVKKATLQSILV